MQAEPTTLRNQQSSSNAPARPSRPLRAKILRIALVILLTLLVVAGGTAYWALDRFVIDHVEIADVAAYEAAVTGTGGDTDIATATTGDVSLTATAGSDTESAAQTAAVVTANSYSDEDTTITITQVTTGSGRNTVTYYVADVVLEDATELRSAFAHNEYGTNIVEYTSDIAADNDAIFAINGDYYGFRTTGILIRNGVVYRDDGARIGLAIYRDGTMAVYDETTTSADQLLADGVWNTLSFGPALLDDGEIVDGIEDVEIDTNFGNHSIQGNQPRTGIGVISANHFVFVVVDGRSPGYSTGVTMTEFAQIFEQLGCTEAYNLDGGGSATMYFNGEVVNNPLGRGTERGTSDILYIAA